MHRVDFVTLFPEMVSDALSHSMMSRAVNAGAVEFGTANPRDFVHDNHRSVDHTSFGGGPGMVMMAPPIKDALDSLKPGKDAAIVLCDATGEKFDQQAANELSKCEHLVFICGHYEGIDERVKSQLATHIFSVGDYVLTGGELPALTMADAVVRLLPGVLGDPESHQDDSHSDGLLGFPLYTKPDEFMGETVPDVLKSGNHAEIAKWRRQKQVQMTRKARPDLFCQSDLIPDDLNLI